MFLPVEQEARLIAILRSAVTLTAHAIRSASTPPTVHIGIPSGLHEFSLRRHLNAIRLAATNTAASASSTFSRRGSSQNLVAHTAIRRRRFIPPKSFEKQPP